MGCGLGRHTVLLADLGFEVIASDPSPRAREATREKLAHQGLKATVIDADMTSIPYPHEHFMGVLSIGVLEHNTKAGIEKALAEVHRVLAPGGRVLASFTPRARWLHKDDPKYDMIEDNTIRRWGPEQVLHHLVDERELGELFGAFAMKWMQPQTEIFTSHVVSLSSTECTSARRKGPPSNAPHLTPARHMAEGHERVKRVKWLAK